MNPSRFFPTAPRSGGSPARWARFLPALLLLPLALLATGCQKNGANGPAFETVPVKRGDLVANVTASGTLVAVVSVDVGSQISGRIRALHADFNSPVKKGDIVAEIDPAIYQAIVDQAKGELASSRAALDLSRITLERLRGLLSQKATPQSEFDKAEAEFRQAQAMVTIKEAVLKKAEADLGYCRIAAPVDGIVIARKVDVGQTMAAAMTTPVLFTIAQDIKKMHIIANVSEADIGQVRAGQPVEFTVDAFPSELFTGVVSQVRMAPTTTENVVTYDTVIDVENPEQRLYPGMTAEVAIRVAERKGVLTLANSALRFAPPEGAVFSNAAEIPAKLARTQRLAYRLDGGKGDGAKPGGSAEKAEAKTTQPATAPAAITLKTPLRAVVVKVGITDGIATEIVEGLHEGDAVVNAARVMKAARGGFGGPPPR